ncbi:MAG: helix-turn-helix domain-containing protein [Alphaproteobacteria bacterium]
MSDRALEVMISRIRQRLKSEQHSLSIRAQRHVGYFITNDIIIED